MSTDKPTGDGLEGIEIPDDLSSLTGSADPSLAVIVTQIAGAQPLAAACSIAEISADAVPTEVGAVAVLADTKGDAPQKAVSALSQLVRGVPFVLVVKSGEQLTAFRWQDGAVEEELAPGLVLGGAPEVLEDLLVGDGDLSEIDGVVASGSVSRWKAMRQLTAAARKARKK
ncbi:hypothetical protein [Paraoerskovia marina]|uniref:hypothetical protein n=1 Tax=Paraoerskovia marina TaxID=545619 RepID=UPI000A4FA241|nr:hypothetical protein [Paraoerskovia marina]